MKRNSVDQKILRLSLARTLPSLLPTQGQAPGTSQNPLSVRCVPDVLLTVLRGFSVQFQNFLELFKFLMKACHRDFATDKFDDPNTM
jgi:hypothetical protein